MKVTPSYRSKQILNELFQIKIVQMYSKELNEHLGLYICSTDKVRMEPANSQVIELYCNIFNVSFAFVSSSKKDIKSPISQNQGHDTWKLSYFEVL